MSYHLHLVFICCREMLSHVLRMAEKIALIFFFVIKSFNHKFIH